MAQGGNLTGWRMAGIGGIAQNCGVVMPIVAYGTALAVIQEDLGTTRGMASLATSVELLALGLLSPLVGNLLQRVSLRATMTVGAVLGFLGHLVVAFAPHFYVVLGAYALLIGPSACLLGPVPVATLVSRWFDKDRGKALGLANVPVFLLFVPPAAAVLLEIGGRQLLFCVLAGMFVLLLPLIQMVQERPDQAPEPAIPVIAGAVAAEPARVLTNLQFLRDWRFWALNMGIGILTGSGTAYTTHGVQIVVGKGIDLTLAASVMSAYGMGTVIGVVVFGWLIDRIGSLPSLVLGTLALAGLWGAFGIFIELTPLLAISAIFGATMGSVVAMHGAAVTELFGAPSVSRGMGLSYFLKIPFLFGFPYLLGRLYDLHDNYELALAVTAGMVTVAALLFMFLAFTQRGRKHPG